MHGERHLTHQDFGKFTQLPSAVCRLVPGQSHLCGHPRAQLFLGYPRPCLSKPLLGDEHCLGMRLHSRHRVFHLFKAVDYINQGSAVDLLHHRGVESAFRCCSAQGRDDGCGKGCLCTCLRGGRPVCG